MDIHTSAIVSPDAEIGPQVEIGPFAVIESEVSIGGGTVIGPHAVIRRYSRIGAGNFIDARAVIGGSPRYAGFVDADSRAELGDNNVIREGVTIDRGFEPGSVTRIGSGCVFMANAHVGHDCVVEDQVTLCNGVMLGGHVHVGRNAVMGGSSGAHQFVRVGAFCMVAGYVALRKDVIPYTLVGGEPVRHFRLNTVGLRRNGITGDRHRALEHAFRALRNGDRMLEGVANTEEVRLLLDWLTAGSKYGSYRFAGNGP